MMPPSSGRVRSDGTGNAAQISSRRARAWVAPTRSMWPLWIRQRPEAPGRDQFRGGGARRSEDDQDDSAASPRRSRAPGACGGDRARCGPRAGTRSAGRWGREARRRRSSTRPEGSGRRGRGGQSSGARAAHLAAAAGVGRIRPGSGGSLRGHEYLDRLHRQPSGESRDRSSVIERADDPGRPRIGRSRHGPSMRTRAVAGVGGAGRLIGAGMRARSGQSTPPSRGWPCAWSSMGTAARRDSAGRRSRCRSTQQAPPATGHRGEQALARSSAAGRSPR